MSFRRECPPHLGDHARQPIQCILRDAEHLSTTEVLSQEPLHVPLLQIGSSEELACKLLR